MHAYIHTYCRNTWFCPLIPFDVQTFASLQIAPNFVHNFSHAFRDAKPRVSRLRPKSNALRRITCIPNFPTFLLIAYDSYWLILDLEYPFLIFPNKSYSCIPIILRTLWFMVLSLGMINGMKISATKVHIRVPRCKWADWIRFDPDWLKMDWLDWLLRP